jgi:AraC-like DNA-binding protein
MSFVQYLNYYRLSKAKKWLAETNETIEAIAKRAGIEDGAYFSRLFKKIEGVTPTEYRRTVLSIFYLIEEKTVWRNVCTQCFCFYSKLLVCP